MNLLSQALRYTVGAAINLAGGLLLLGQAGSNLVG